MFQAQTRNTLIFSCVIFICLGICNSSIGPILPELAKNAQVSLASMGAVFTAFFSGSVLTMLILGTITDRVGQRPILLAGLFFIAMGLFAYNFQLSYWAVLGFSFLAGLGLGAVVLGNNVLISNTFPDQNVSALNLINFFYGVGAIAGPAIVGLVIARFGSGRWVVGLDAVLFLCLVPFIARIKDAPMAIKQNTPAVKISSLLKSPFLWSLGLMTLLYVGIETGLGGWISTYINRTTLLSLETSALVASAFWFAFTLGRLLNTWLGMRLTPVRILIFNVSGAVLGSLLLVFSTGYQIITIIAILIIGFCFGAIYPTLIAVTTSAFRSSPGQAASIVSSMGNAGGMTVPFIQGILIGYFGPTSLTWSAVVLIGLILAVLLATRNTLVRSTYPAA